MYTIKEDTENTLVIKNSKFITELKRCQKEDDVKSILGSIREKYPKATHYCYAYIIGLVKHSSDDHEPSNTAGLPMLNILEKQEINNCIAVVVRYFGGIKLGAGGLVRAYKKSVTSALDNTVKVVLKQARLITLSIPYDEQKDLEYLLRDSKIINKEYNERVCYHVIIEEKNLPKIDRFNYQIIEDAYLEEGY